jgi:hypothetical protein
MAGSSKRFLKLSEGFETCGGERRASPAGVSSSAVSLLRIMNGIRREYMYTQTANVKSIILKNGANSADCSKIAPYMFSASVH